MTRKSRLRSSLTVVLAVAIVEVVSAGEVQDPNRTPAPRSASGRTADRGASAAEILSRWSADVADGGSELASALPKLSMDALTRARAATTLASLDDAVFGRDGSRSLDGASVVPNTLGDAGQDLTFFPLTPCRLVDTRSTSAGILLPGVARDFDANGTNLTAQGGSATGCGVVEPDPVAVAVTITAVGPAGPGDLRAWATNGAVPNASVVNYALPGQGLNLANTTIIPLLQSVGSVNEFTVRADVSAAHVVVDVVGYFDHANLDLPEGTASSVATTGGPLPGSYFSGVNIVPTRPLSCFVTADLAWSANGGPPASGSGLLRTARRNVTTATDTDDGGIFNYIGALGSMSAPLRRARSGRSAPARHTSSAVRPRDPETSWATTSSVRSLGPVAKPSAPQGRLTYTRRRRGAPRHPRRRTGPRRGFLSRGSRAGTRRASRTPR